MAKPSSQTLAMWVRGALQTGEWQPLSELCVLVVKRRITRWSETEVYEFVEANLVYVAEHLRNDASYWKLDGTSPEYVIDDDPRPYIRGIDDGIRPLLMKLRCITPDDFEHVCSRMLKELGAEQARKTQQTNDGGIDFEALRLNIVPTSLSLPEGCKAAVIGQAKRYKEENNVKETMIREFVGAAMLRRHDIQKEGKIQPFSPVLFAFWTTSSFTSTAKEYARSLGLWHMDGRTLANYVKHLEMANYVMGLPDA